MTSLKDVDEETLFDVALGDASFKGLDKLFNY